MIANTRTNDGASCVYICAQEGYSNCLQILLNNGASVDVLTNEGIHPVVPAVKRKFYRCAKMILEKASVEAIHYSAVDPIFVAIEENSSECFALLLEAGLDVNRLTEYYSDFAVPLYGYLQPILVKTRSTPLTMAVNRYDVDAVRQLLTRGAKTFYAGNNTYSPLIQAVLKRKMPELLEAFFEFDTPLNGISKGSRCRVSDALLVSLHPIYRGQLIKLLKAGVKPNLELWCECRKTNEHLSGGRFSLLAEISNLLTRDELYNLLYLLVQFTTGIPNCCTDWRAALGSSSWRDLEPFWGSPLSLQQLCRLQIRKDRTTKELYKERWVEQLRLPSGLKDFLLYKEVQ